MQTTDDDGERCLICWGRPIRYFDSNHNYPLCGRQHCDEEMAKEVNEQLNNAAAEAAQI